jgi:AAA+ ATPase superfamily predicted ATPase
MSTSNLETHPDPESYFTVGPYITDPQKFFGREEELRVILNRLRTMQSTSVVGERRIGKSSVFYHIYQTGNARLQTNDPHFVFIDMQEAKFQRQDLFLKNVLKELDLPHTRIQPDAYITEALVVFSEELEKLERKPVLLVDEFDDGLKHGRYSENFFEHLRSMIGSRKLGFVTVK